MLLIRNELFLIVAMERCLPKFPENLSRKAITDNPVTTTHICGISILKEKLN